MKIIIRESPALDLAMLSLKVDRQNSNEVNVLYETPSHPLPLTIPDVRTMVDVTERGLKTYGADRQLPASMRISDINLRLAHRKDG